TFLLSTTASVPARPPNGRQSETTSAYAHTAAREREFRSAAVQTPYHTTDYSCDATTPSVRVSHSVSTTSSTKGCSSSKSRSGLTTSSPAGSTISRRQPTDQPSRCGTAGPPPTVPTRLMSRQRTFLRLRCEPQTHRSAHTSSPTRCR